MKYIFVMTLCITLLLWWCSLWKEEILASVVDNNNEEKNFNWNEKNELWVTFMSWDAAFSYTNQERIMWEIQYPEQKDIIVLEWYGRGVVDMDRVYHIPWVYWNIVINSGSMIYDTVFSFTGLESETERNYKRTYVWAEKWYREDFWFLSRKTGNSLGILSISQSEFYWARPDLEQSIQWFCTRDHNTMTIIKEWYTDDKKELYVLYQDDGVENKKTTVICFEKQGNFYEIKLHGKEYREDVVNSIQFL